MFLSEKCMMNCQAILLFHLLALSCLLCGVYGSNLDTDDNDFAEFEDFQDEAFEETAPISPPQAEVKQDFDDMNVAEDDFDDGVTIEVEDWDEFEGSPNKKEEPKITFAQVPHHLRPNWDSFVLELLILAGLVVYFINFFLGRSKNQRITSMWLEVNRTVLDENFSLIGDDGKLDIENPGFIKDAEHLYSLWCSGRVCCEGMLVELKLLKRQDLVSIIQYMLKPKEDTIQMTVKLDDMDSFVMCLAKKKVASVFSKDMTDISTYCPERKSAEKLNVPSNYLLMSEIGEASTALIDQRVVSFLNKYPEVIESIHISDQYSGNKVPEEGAALTRLPSTEKVVIVTLSLCGRNLEESIEASKLVTNLVLHLVDKASRLRLTREAKVKAEKNRQKVEEAFLKNTHALRAEAAAAKREEKRRLEKERILAEEDPEKQRKWEEKEAKKEAKRKAPKMKQMKVRA
ncbi:PAT complex subunit CCDC47-like isoform X1 [Artemia franciscana]